MTRRSTARMFNGERRRIRRPGPPLLLPLIAAVLMAIVVMRDARSETYWGVKDRAEIINVATAGPILPTEAPFTDNGGASGGQSAAAPVTAWGVKDQGAVATVLIINPPCRPACSPPLVREFTIMLKERR